MCAFGGPNTQVPLQLRLADTDVTSLPAPEPLYVMAPRMSYLPLLAQAARDHFRVQSPKPHPLCKTLGCGTRPLLEVLWRCRRCYHPQSRSHGSTSTAYRSSGAFVSATPSGFQSTPPCQHPTNQAVARAAAGLHDDATSAEGSQGYSDRCTVRHVGGWRSSAMDAHSVCISPAHVHSLGPRDSALAIRLRS
jgi:hypothetical protein